MRKTQFVPGEYYHIYNRGVDKRPIFMDLEDKLRFIQSIEIFSNVEQSNSIFRKNRKKCNVGSLAPNIQNFQTIQPKLVEFVAFRLLENHFHFEITPLLENGIQIFMHRLGTGYTNYFNEKYNRSGSLFQGSYKATNVNSNEYLLHLSVYINMNHRLHSVVELDSKTDFSSWREYQGKKSLFKDTNLSNQTIIIDQFRSHEDYCQFAESVLPNIISMKAELKKLEKFLID